MNKPACSIQGCTEPQTARTWCNSHYLRFRKHGSPTADVRPRVAHRRPDVMCAKCGEPAMIRGLCQRHYQSTYMSSHTQERRSAWIRERGGKCVKCGSTDRIEIDHVDPSVKEHEVSRLWSLREDSPIRADELAKCQLLCFTCHRAKTAAEQTGRKTSVRALKAKVPA